MAFQYPQFLYALFLLIIPILIHLFQLRKFKKVEFTNVALLKEISIQSRKSSKLKKYLVLLSRLLAFTALVLAFAQPYLPNDSQQDKETEYVIYLDNSFSMEYQKGTKSVFEEARQELIKFLPEEQELIVFTNNQSFRNIQNLKNELLSVELTSKNLSLEQVLLKSNAFFSNSEHTQKKLILLSDFQTSQPKAINYQDYLSYNQELYFIQLQPEKPTNTSIQSVNYQEIQNQIELDVALLAQGEMNKTIDVSVFDQNQLIARKQVSFENEKSINTKFKLANQAYPKGKIEINSEGLTYDNQFYFSLNKATQLEVLSINQTSDNFLKRIYQNKDFNYSSYNLNELPFSSINQSDIIILNEVKDYSANLVNALQKYIEEGGQLIVIPSVENVTSLNNFLKKINLQPLGKQIQESIQLTKINFQHPIYQNTFVSEIDNFDYPNFKKAYQYPKQSSTALYYSNQQPTLISQDNVSLFTTALNIENSNFQNSPLIVPTFYNLAQLNRLESQLQFQLHSPNSIKINWTSTTDDVIQLVDEKSTIQIPQQQKFFKYVEINTSEVPKEAGNYAVLAQGDTLKYLSFNYPRNQSILTYYPFEDKDEIYTSIAGFFDDLRKQQEIKSYWYWFVIFAFIFLLVEVLLLNYFKP